MRKQITFQCSREEKENIKNKADRLGISISDFICDRIEGKLPIKKVPHFSKNVGRRQTITITASDMLNDKIVKNLKKLRHGPRIVKRWELLLYISLQEDE